MQGEELSTKILDVINHVSDGQFVFVHDMRTGVSTWSKEAVDYFGLPSMTLQNTEKVLGVLVHPDDFPKWVQELNDIFTLRKDIFFYTYQIRNKSGQYVYCTQKGKTVLDKMGRPAIFTGSLTIHKNEIEYDSVTDLPKQREYLEEIKRLKDDKKECLSMIIEMKKFHSINTLYGYEFGNKTLYELARFMKSLLGSAGKLYRLEGAIFAFVIWQNDLNYVKELFHEIREGCSAFQMDGFALNLEVAGGALYTENSAVSAQTILSCLFSALEQSKEEEHYNLVVFDDEKNKDNYRLLELLDTVKVSIRNSCEGFYLCYQPFVSTLTGKIIGAEALVRWKNPVFGAVSPGRFVPYLESHPCFYDLSLWVLRQAVIDSKKILEKVPSFFINVNMSYSQLERESFKTDVIRVLDEVGYPKDHLQLELTERCRNLDMDYLREQLSFFRSHGIKIALDDFGTGSSTISLLCDLPINCVKIDQTFILHILDKSNNPVIVDSTVQCAKRLGLNVCLEGVENQEIKDFIGQYSANYHQGYFYSKPVELDTFFELLSNSWESKEIAVFKANSQEFLSADSILSRIPGGFFIYLDNPEERIIQVNETLLTIFECDTVEEFTELTGGSFRGIVHPDDYEMVNKSIYQQIGKNDDKMDFVKYRITTKTGKVKYVHDYGHWIPNELDEDMFYVFLVEVY